MLPFNKVLYECFEKNGSEYECVISPKEEQSKHNKIEVLFHVLLRFPNQANYIRFVLFSSGDGHWEPDDRKLVDPWVADMIGKIIIENF